MAKSTPPKKCAFTPRRLGQAFDRPTQIMSKEAPLSLVEREFILDALRGNLRLDGRGLDQFRTINISFGNEYGHVKLQLGKTRCATIPLAELFISYFG